MVPFKYVPILAITVALLEGCYADPPSGGTTPAYTTKSSSPNSRLGGSSNIPQDGNFRYFKRGTSEVWTPPPGVTTVRVELWGGHGIPFSTKDLVPGKKYVMGGGGAYARKVITNVNPVYAIGINFSIPNGSDGLTVTLKENDKETLEAGGGKGGTEVDFSSGTPDCTPFSKKEYGMGGKPINKDAQKAVEVLMDGKNGSGPCKGSQVSQVGQGADPTGEMQRNLDALISAGEIPPDQEGWEAQAKVSW